MSTHRVMSLSPNDVLTRRVVKMDNAKFCNLILVNYMPKAFNISIFDLWQKRA